MALMNRLNARSVATLGAGKYNDGAGLLLHKRKDGCSMDLPLYHSWSAPRNGIGCVAKRFFKKSP